MTTETQTELLDFPAPAEVITKITVQEPEDVGEADKSLPI